MAKDYHDRVREGEGYYRLGDEYFYVTPSGVIGWASGSFWEVTLNRLVKEGEVKDVGYPGTYGHCDSIPSPRFLARCERVSEQEALAD